uniref:Uncharacterized protein n=1 Tax=Cacopsylla melanoneura TaxID=428564 RepID=A0A8D8LUP2_9HEMI
MNHFASFTCFTVQSISSSRVEKEPSTKFWITFPPRASCEGTSINVEKKIIITFFRCELHGEYGGRDIFLHAAKHQAGFLLSHLNKAIYKKIWVSNKSDH